MDPKSEQTAEATSKPPNEIYRTVKLNVGGFLFEVFRTLIEANESSMIAALVSERWNEDAQATIFIDRDGENFRYCLQFLRNGCVDLPLTISRDEFLRDMDYYGLDWKEHQVTHGAAVLKCLQNAKEEITTLTTEASRAENRKKYARLAEKALARFLETGGLILVYTIDDNNDKEEFECCRLLNDNAENLEEFNCHLQKYGLAVKRVNVCLGYTVVELQGIGTL